jgi:hypothetical protein
MSITSNLTTPPKREVTQISCGSKVDKSPLWDERLRVWYRWSVVEVRVAKATLRNCNDFVGLNPLVLHDHRYTLLIGFGRTLCWSYLEQLFKVLIAQLIASPTIATDLVFVATIALSKFRYSSSRRNRCIDWLTNNFPTGICGLKVGYYALQPPCTTHISVCQL